MYIKIVKQKQSKYHISSFNLLTTKKLELFFIRRKIKKLTYKFELFNNMKIYFVIFVIHLKQTKKNKFEKQDFSFLISRPIIMNKKLQ